MSASSSTEQLNLTFRVKGPASNRGSILPGGWWLWCLLGATVGIGCWLVSRQYLARQFGWQLASATNRGEAMYALEGLLMLNANNTEDIVTGLRHDDEYIARTAFRTLDAQITWWQKLASDEAASKMCELAQALKNLPDDLPSENSILVSNLASRMFTIGLGNDLANHQPLLTLCEAVIQRTASVKHSAEYALADVSQPPPPLSAGINSNTTSDYHFQFTDEANSLPPQELASQPSTTTTSQNSSIATLGVAMKIGEPTMIGDEPHASLRLVAAPTQPRSGVTETSLRVSDNGVSESLPLPLSMPNSEPSEAVTIRGIDDKSIKELVRLLGSIQPRIAQAAALALRRKNMTDDKLQLAIELATGSEARRLELIEQVATRGDLDPRVWLLWMAEDGQSSVRKRSISFLHGMLDEDVMRELRMLLNREQDEQVASVIRQTLLSQR